MIQVKSTIMTAAMTGVLLTTMIAPAFAQTTVTPTLGPGGKVVCNSTVVRLNDAVARAQNLENRWDNVSNRLSTANQKITSTLQAKDPSALPQYQTLVSTFVASVGVATTDAHNYYTALTKAQADANAGMCGVSNGAFKADLQALKTAWQPLKTDAQTNRTNYQAIKTYLNGLRTSVTPTPTP